LIGDDFSIPIFEASKFWLNVVNVIRHWFWWISITIGWINAAWNEFREDKSILKPDLEEIFKKYF
jgi:hypothetical protein